ncbi:MAG: hypothetical protein R3263_09640 [Myxococcota bacterium]|nr:hypothetical protein [Myxococcota bacterium]
MRRPWLALVALLVASPVGAERPPLVLELCQGYVASAEVVAPAREDGSFGLAIRLLPDAARGFAELTGDHVGRTLEIHIGPEHVLRATIRQPIRSGLISTGGYATREEAEEARAAALASRTRACRSPAPGTGGEGEAGASSGDATPATESSGP